MADLCLFLTLLPCSEMNVIQGSAQAFGFSLVSWKDFASLYAMCGDSSRGVLNMALLQVLHFVLV